MEAEVSRNAVKQHNYLFSRTSSSASDKPWNIDEEAILSNLQLPPLKSKKKKKKKKTQDGTTPKKKTKKSGKKSKDLSPTSTPSSGQKVKKKKKKKSTVDAPETVSPVSPVSPVVNSPGLSNIPSNRSPAGRRSGGSGPPRASPSRELLAKALSQSAGVNDSLPVRGRRAMTTLEPRIINYSEDALARLAKSSTMSDVILHPSFIAALDSTGRPKLQRSQSDPTLKNSWDYVPFYAPLVLPKNKSSNDKVTVDLRRKKKLKKTDSMDLTGFDLGLPSIVPDKKSDDKKKSEDIIEYEDGLDENGRKIVKAGNIEGLISFLIQSQDYDWMRNFFVCHIWFLSSKDLMEILITRWQKYKDDEKYKDNRMGLQLRLINVVKKWVEWYVEDFVTTEVMRIKLSDFLQNVTSTKGNFEKWTKGIFQTLLDEKKREQEEKEARENPNSQFDISEIPQYPKNLTWLQIHPKELANQITLVDHDLFRKIKYSELTSNSWLKQGNVNSPNVLTLIDRFNKVCYWVAAEIVSAANVKKRIVVLGRFIQIARYLKEANNYHGAMTLYSALNLGAIQRLKNTWKGLNSKQKQTLKELDELFLPISNYKNYFAALGNTQGPCVPIISILLGRLSSLEEALENKTENGLINYRKMNQIGKMLLEYVKKWKEDVYDEIPRVEVVIDYIEDRLKNDVMTDKALYDASRQIEPSREEKEKRTPRLFSRKKAK